MLCKVVEGGVVYVYILLGRAPPGALMALLRQSMKEMSASSSSSADARLECSEFAGDAPAGGVPSSRASVAKGRGEIIGFTKDKLVLRAAAPRGGGSGCDVGKGGGGAVTWVETERVPAGDNAGLLIYVCMCACACACACACIYICASVTASFISKLVKPLICP
jgi:hypothetical protein